MFYIFLSNTLKIQMNNQDIENVTMPKRVALPLA